MLSCGRDAGGGDNPFGLGGPVNLPTALVRPARDLTVTTLVVAFLGRRLRRAHWAHYLRRCYHPLNPL
jgi:hypothetical protein